MEVNQYQTLVSKAMVVALLTDSCGLTLHQMRMVEMSLNQTQTHLIQPLYVPYGMCAYNQMIFIDNDFSV